MRAILSDASHLLTDLMSFVLSLVAIRVAQKQKTSTYTYGFLRVEIIVALFNVAFIWIVTGVLVNEAIKRVQKPQEIKGDLMLLLASAAVVFNLMYELHIEIS